jgi:hypothetical protein
MACLVSPFEVCNCCAVTRTLASCGSNTKNQGEHAAAVTTSRLARMNVTVGCFEPENVERGDPSIIYYTCRFEDGVLSL